MSLEYSNNYQFQFSLTKIWIYLNSVFYNLNFLECESQTIILAYCNLTKERIKEDHETPVQDCKNIWTGDVFFQLLLSMFTDYEHIEAI